MCGLFYHWESFRLACSACVERKIFFFQKSKKSCTYITIIIGKKHKKMPPRKKKSFSIIYLLYWRKNGFFLKIKVSSNITVLLMKLWNFFWAGRSVKVFQNITVISYIYHLHKVAQNILPNILPFSLKFIMKLYTHVKLT